MAVLFVSVLILAFLVFCGALPESAIPIGNTVIKILAALAAGVVIGFGRERASWLSGGIAAVCTLLLSALGMCFYLGEFRWTWSMLADALLCFAIGCAACAVFLRGRTES